MARVEDDGTLTLLGRGNTCVNSGGEKVFPEEVEGRARNPTPTCSTRWSSACPTTCSGSG